MNKKLIIVFGGSFNPPTLAHINLAKQIINKIDRVEKVIFVPVSTKYNKDGLASDKIRFEMLRKICENNDKLEISSIELDSPRQLYTIETLSKIQNQNLENEVCFMLGTDNLKEIETWHKAEELIATFTIFVLKRDNDNMEEIIEKSPMLKRYRNSFIELKEIEPIKLSASYIRERVKKGQNIDGLVPEKIKNDVIKVYQNKSDVS